ncbi:MAG: ABC transporter ATP-binding protein [Chloroflexi bacterium]|nr:ABC transporter ATP-binding protein [Chloroflexota bacterium]
MATVITAEGLTKRFGSLVAVDGLDLEVHEGEVFGFLGPNGAGKTTTLRLLCALIAPTSGTAEIAGYRVGRDDERIRAMVGILTEQPGLYERLTATENLRFYAALYGLPGTLANEQVERFLRMLGLWDRRDAAVATFSRGMKQKMAIARAALHEPPVMFLDEPTTGLDPDAAKTVRAFITALRAEGRTVFLCTHNLDEADRLCDRIAFFRRSVIRIDTPDHLRQELYGRTTELRLLAPASAAELERLRTIEGVRAVEQRNGSLSVTSDDPARTNARVVRALVEGGADIAFVTERKVPLEEVYLRIVEGTELE